MTAQGETHASSVDAAVRIAHVIPATAAMMGWAAIPHHSVDPRSSGSQAVQEDCPPSVKFPTLFLWISKILPIPTKY